jgi:hypothetical protein
LAIDAFKQKFKGYIKQLVTEPNLMDEMYSVNWITAAHNLIEDHLINVTGDNQTILDRPATWGNQASYRLFDLNSGKNWYATRKTAVLNSFKSPVADAGPNITIEVGQSVHFDGSASTDSDGNIVDYQWSNNLTGMSPTLVYKDVGTFVVTLTVIDNDNNSDQDELTITVSDKSIVKIPSEEIKKGAASFPILFLLVLFVIRGSRAKWQSLL